MVEGTGVPVKLYVKFSSDVLDVVTKYSSVHDAHFTLGKRGPNAIFDFISIKKINNSSEFVSNELGLSLAFWSNITDSFGPHIIKAVNTIDGDLPSSNDFTGGNHNYNNTGDSGISATGRTASILLKANGRPVESYDGYANDIEIQWVNYVQATNTKKSDGTGREVLKETYRMVYDGVDWKVDCQLEMLEAVNYITYYGLQFAYGSVWNGGIFFHTSANMKWNANSGVGATSQDKYCNRITIRSSNLQDFVEIDIDTGFGIGRHQYLDATYAAHSKSYGKAYMFLIGGGGTHTFAQGDVISYRGSYRFYSAV